MLFGIAIPTSLYINILLKCFLFTCNNIWSHIEKWLFTTILLPKGACGVDGIQELLVTFKDKVY